MTALPDSTPRRGWRDDRGELTATYALKLFAVLGVLGVFGYDGAAIMSAHVRGESSAQDAADAASQVWNKTHNVDQAYQAAQANVADKPETVLTKTFSIDADGTVHLEIRRTAKTLVFAHIGALKKYTVTVQHGDAKNDST